MRVTETDQEDYCCHLGPPGEIVEHSGDLYQLAWYPSTPDNNTVMCGDHLVQHLQEDQSTTIYPKGVEW